MDQPKLVVSALLALAWSAAASAQSIVVRHIQRPMHRWMVACSEAGNIIARGEFSQVTQGDEVTMHLAYQFVDGSIDDETTTYSQRGTFRLVRYHHLQKGPFFARPADYSIDAPTGTVSIGSIDRDGKPNIQTTHLDLPADIANGFVGTLLINVPQNTAPFRAGILAPVGKGRLIRILISPEGEQTFRMAGQPLKATVFRIHPELGGIVGWVAPLLGLQPKDVIVWVQEGDEPAVVRIIGQLGGAGPIISSELEGTSFSK